jgi:hypothetical protein
VLTQLRHEARNLFGTAMRGIGKLIYGHPWGSLRHAGIPRVEMLVEMVAPEADDREMNALCPFGA